MAWAGWGPATAGRCPSPHPTHKAQPSGDPQSGRGASGGFRCISDPTVHGGCLLVLSPQGGLAFRSAWAARTRQLVRSPVCTKWGAWSRCQQHTDPHGRACARCGHLTSLALSQATEQERQATGAAVHSHRVDGAQRPGADGELRGECRPRVLGLLEGSCVTSVSEVTMGVGGWHWQDCAGLFPK